MDIPPPSPRARPTSTSTAATLATAFNADLDRVDPSLAYIYYSVFTAQQTQPDLPASRVGRE